jgi:hypothetical protein
MSKVMIGVGLLLDRTIELLNTDCRLPPAPYPSLHHTTRSGELGFGGGTIVLWGPVERPDFVIDEAEVPY